MNRPTNCPETRKTGSAFIRAGALYLLLPVTLLCAVVEFAPADYFGVRTSARRTSPSHTDDTDSEARRLAREVAKVLVARRTPLANTAGADTVNFNGARRAHHYAHNRQLVVQSATISVRRGQLPCVQRCCEHSAFPRFRLHRGTVSVSGGRSAARHHQEGAHQKRAR